MPVWSLAAGHQQQHPGWQVVEEELQAAVEHRPLGQMVVIQHQQQRLAIIQFVGQLIKQTIEPLFEREGLMALTHLQQAERLLPQGRIELLQPL